jgi:ATP-dependent DNA helicase RecG
MQLKSPVKRVPKIGSKYQKLLENVEVRTVGDLIYHFPHRYDDFSVVKEIADLVLDDAVTVVGTLESIDNIYTRNRKKLTKAVFKDKTGTIDATWFNMHYLKKQLRIGETYKISGKITGFNNKLGFIAPTVEMEGKGINTARLVPIYPETAGLSSKWLRARINDVLLGKSSTELNLEEFLPKMLMDRHNLLEFSSALKIFHFPESFKDVEVAKKRFAYEELFLELLKIEERRQAWEEKLECPVIEHKKQKKSVEKLIDGLPFDLTHSQKESLKHIFSDMGKKHPMNRLLEGDVGSGKTIVAVISAYLAHLNGYKTLYMAPTEILANQHFVTFNKFLGASDVKIDLKTGSSKEFDTNADIIIGTHALIYLEEIFDKVGLIVIDEQQRFGVAQRTKLMELGTKGKIPHLLTMTATPIPRTLALTLYGDLDISSIEAHKNRYENIKTWILPENKRKDAFDWVVKQDLPTFIVCPLIEESEHEIMANVKAAEVEYERLSKGPFKDKNVGLLHGRMKPKEKQLAIDDFSTGKIDVLVSTPVIEVGVDIPDATIMVIESAERYGLASLHQLRGRIGRGGQKAFCMLFSSNNSKHSIKRLKHLEKHNSGLKLAEIDLKLRGQGDIYGTDQHGFVTFKVADLSDVDLLNTAKEDAQNYYPHLNEYPKLKEKIHTEISASVDKN